MSRTIPMLFCLTLLAGCTTPKYMRERAAALEPIVEHYRQQQQENLDRLNADYRQTFGHLMEDLGRLARQDEEQWFTLDVQKNADVLAADWEKETAQREFRDIFSRALVTDRQRIKDIDAAVARTRESYANSYKEASLQLDKIKVIEQNLKHLSEKDKLSPETLSALKNVIEAIRKGLDEGTKPRKEGA